MIQPAEMETGLAPKLDALADRVSEIYLHFDLDALDPEFAPGAGYRCPDGISLAQAQLAIAMIGDRVNNTGPGVRTTAGCVLRKAGFTGADGTDIKDLLDSLERTQNLATAA